MSHGPGGGKCKSPVAARILSVLTGHRQSDAGLLRGRRSHMKCSVRSLDLGIHGPEEGDGEGQLEVRLVMRMEAGD